MEAPARRAQELHVMPMTRWGKSALGFAGMFVLLCGLFIVLVMTGPQGGTTLTFGPRMIPGVLAVGCAALALVTGAVGIALRGERSLVGFAATGIGFFVVAFVVGEFAIPPFD